MAIIISDTNIFVDLYNTELLDYLFSLTEEIHTVKQVLFELINTNPRLPKSDIDQLIDDLQKNS